jgi:hypothetical protein
LIVEDLIVEGLVVEGLVVEGLVVEGLVVEDLVEDLDFVGTLTAFFAGRACSDWEAGRPDNFLARVAAAGFGLDNGLRVIFGMIRVY